MTTVKRSSRLPRPTIANRPRRAALAELISIIKEDLHTNRGWPKSQLALALFRVAHHVRHPLDRPPRLVARPVGFAYKVIVEWLLGIEIPWRTKVGRRLRLYHGVGLVVNEWSVVGDDVTLRQGVTIGNTGEGDDCPVLNSGVDVGAGAVIIGPIHLGQNARIGANAVVTHDIPANATAVGIPARVVVKEQS